MNTNKRLRSKELITIILSLALLGTLSAQQMGNHNHKRHAQKKRQQIRFEQQIEHKMDQIIERTSKLVDVIQNTKYIDNAGSIDGGQLNEGLIFVVHDMDKMARGLQKLKEHMDTIVRNQNIMDNPKMGKHMKDMMNGTIGVISEMEKIILNSINSDRTF